MILTEEEAKTKQCCGGDRCGRIVGDGKRVCIGSACMAWRWHNDGLSDYPPDTKGFCGKAGRP